MVVQNEEDETWWYQQLQKMCVDDKDMFKNTYIIGNGSEIADLIREGKLTMGSDGSFQPEIRIGTCAFKFESHLRERVAQGVCQTSGSKRM